MWSIAIYTGATPFNLQPRPPVLTKSDVTDIPADFVADPFMLRRDHTWYMFFEVMQPKRNSARSGSPPATTLLPGLTIASFSKSPSISHTRTSSNGKTNTTCFPRRSRPAPFACTKLSIFRIGWSIVARLIEGKLADPSILRFNDLWWLFACSTPYQHDTLRLYFASDLTGPWTEHPKSPLIRNDECRARPAGRILKFGNRLFRFAQDCMPQYGSSVRAFEIYEVDHRQLRRSRASTFQFSERVATAGTQRECTTSTHTNNPTAIGSPASTALNS